MYTLVIFEVSLHCILEEQFFFVIYDNFQED